MAKTLSLVQVRTIIESGEFDALKGAVEDQTLECKNAPYQIEHSHQKQELAKDVTALANVTGGVILIGVRTERDTAHMLGDEIKELSPFLRTQVDPERYHAVLKDWVYPGLKEVDIRWFPSTQNREKGIVAINIPKQPQSNHPFLITKTIDERGKEREILFGYVERRRANAEPKAVEELHSLIRDGIQSSSISQKLDVLQQSVERLQQQPPPSGPSAEALEIKLRGRIGLALSEVDLGSHRPTYILTCVPAHPLEVEGLFESRSAEIVKTLEHPPELRYSGFDVDAGETAEIVSGVRRRAMIPQYKILCLWQDGTLIFAADGGPDFLSWGRLATEHGPMRINQLALVESVFLFTSLSQKVFEHANPQPRELEYRLEIRNMTVNSKPCILAGGPLDKSGFGFGSTFHSAEEASKVFVIKWRGRIEPGRVAFQLVAQLYQWFGFTHDQIPYSEGTGDRRMISPQEILRLNQTA